MDHDKKPGAGPLRRGAVLLAVGLAACTGPGGAPMPARPGPVHGGAAPGGMSLEQQVGQTLLMSFAGLREPAYVARILQRRLAAGVILTPENVASPRQLHSLTGALERSAGGRALVGVDQEGGAVRSLRFTTAVAGQAGQVGAAAAGAAARRIGRDLRRYGLNVDFAPVADVAVDDGSIMRSRAFPGTAPVVADSVRAAVSGYAAVGLAAAVKHFPGLGAAGANTDARPVTISTPLAIMRRRELVPFRAAIAAGVPLIMVSHALYPALDPERIASQSPLIIEPLLRRSLGYGGVVITDSIEAAAVRSRSDVAQAAVRSIRAGADIVLMTGPGSYHLIFPRLLERARRSSAFRRRVSRAAGRVLALQRRLGLVE